MKDRNAQFFVDELAKRGFSAGFIGIVGDVPEGIGKAVNVSVQRADVVIMTGGLGPTSDDLTVQSVADAFGLSLVLDESVVNKIEELFRRRNRFMSESNLKQAMVPDGAEVLENENGTAPGILIRRGETMVFLLPGVPLEAKNMFLNSVLPLIVSNFKSETVEYASVRVTGITESEVYDAVKNIPGAADAIKYYPSPEGIELKIITGSGSEFNAGDIRNEITGILGDKVYSIESENLQAVVGRLLKEKNITVAVAESCTGGLIADRLTDIPGSSDYFLCGVVTYSNKSKIAFLGVDGEAIKAHGAVSSEVAAMMAEGVRKISGADIGLSATGIAGPGGATMEKPVGLMYAGISTKDGTQTKKLQFVEDRIINKKRMSQAVLDMARIYLKEI